MKIIYITNQDPNSQCDYQEVSMLHGLREVLRDNCIDHPRKKIMYGDFSEWILFCMELPMRMA